MGQLADFQFDIKYRPGKTNIDADTLSRCPLDIDTFMAERTEELTDEAVCAVWEGGRRAQQKDVAWVAALNLASQNQHECEPLQAISHNELVRDQRKNPTIGRVINMKESDTPLRDEDGKSRHPDKKVVKGMEEATFKRWPPVQDEHRATTAGPAHHIQTDSAHPSTQQHGARGGGEGIESGASTILLALHEKRDRRVCDQKMLLHKKEEASYT